MSSRHHARHVIWLAALSIVVSTVVAACNRQPPSGGASGRPRVAFVMKTLNHPFFLDMKRGAEEAAGKLGIDLVVQAAERELDVEKQTQIIENLIQTGVRALCVTPSGSKEVASVLAKATRANIPIVVADTRVDPAAGAAAGVKLGTFVGSDNYEGGRLAGQFLVQSSGGQAKVAILEGIPGHETGDSRLRGFRDAVAGSPGITIVASQPANWERDQGFTVFQNMLQAHADIDSLFAASDLMALGVIRAAHELGLAVPQAISVVGSDDSQLMAFTDPPLTTVRQPVRSMSETAVRLLADRLHGLAAECHEYVFRPELVVRGSTWACKET